MVEPLASARLEGYSGKVHRVAQEIAAVDFRANPADAWEMAVDQESLDMYIALAIGAIRGMREPTEQMILAMQESENDYSTEELRDIWRRGIDSTLYHADITLQASETSGSNNNTGGN